MLRQPGSVYEAGRSSTLLKVKHFHDAEARVVGYVPGAGKHKGRTGSLEVQLPDGVRFAVGTGLSDAERTSPPPVGSTIGFRYQELSDGGVPRFPSYLGLRNDGLVTAAPLTPSLGALSPTVKVAVSAPSPSQTRTFEYTEGTSSKFWETWVEGTRMTARYGRIGSRGTMTIKDFADEAAARKAMDKAVAEKVKKGYSEKGNGDEAFSYDDVLVTGDADALGDYCGDVDKCLIVDWREEEQDMLEQLLEIFPQAGLSWEDDEEEEDLYVTFGGARSKVGLTMSPKDRYILLRRLNVIMAGKYELRAFRCTLYSDTHCFYPQSVAWWSRMEAMFPARVAEIFARITPEMDF